MRGKKPTRKQRHFIEEHKLNAYNWLVVKDTPELMQIIHRLSGSVRVIPKPRT